MKGTMFNLFKSTKNMDEVIPSDDMISFVHDIGEGQYRLFLDKSHNKHIISNQAIAIIDQEIQKVSN